MGFAVGIRERKAGRGRADLGCFGGEERAGAEGRESEQEQFCFHKFIWWPRLSARRIEDDSGREPG